MNMTDMRIFEEYESDGDTPTGRLSLHFQFDGIENYCIEFNHDASRQYVVAALHQLAHDIKFKVIGERH